MSGSPILMFTGGHGETSKNDYLRVYAFSRIIGINKKASASTLARQSSKEFNLMTAEPIVPQVTPITNPQFLLAAWSVTTPAYVKYSNTGKDSYRKGERRKVYKRLGKKVA